MKITEMLFIGLLISSMGCYIIIKGVFPVDTIYVYVGDNHVEIGMFMLAAGIFIMLFSFSQKARKSKKQYEENNKVLICPQCEKPYPRKEIQDLICPVCKVELKELEGFFTKKNENC